jgi:hypothetical protein
MKLLTVLLLACVLSLGVACSSEPAVPPTATPDVPILSKGEAIGLVQAMLRDSREMDGEYRTCSSRAKFIKGATYLGDGKWEVTFDDKKWHVYEGSNAVQTVRGKC